MTGVPIEKQADYSLLLDEKVKELVRRHLKEALEDPSFMGGVNSYSLAQAVSRNINAGEYNFQQAVKQVIMNQMNKY
jgi:hypothetical protein